MISGERRGGLRLEVQACFLNGPLTNNTPRYPDCFGSRHLEVHNHRRTPFLHMPDHDALSARLLS